jgi:hypothetical protein
MPPTQETGQQSDDIVVFMLRKESKCSECGRELFKGNLLRLEKERPLCMDCADLDRLEYLPSGDASITRRASKYSDLRAVVVRWSSTRKRYERQGILALPDAIRRAEEESLADAALRERRRQREAVLREAQDRDYVAAVAQRLQELFPGCPKEEACGIAEHACEKYSGRVGRSAAARQFDPQALRLAVIAHIRHQHTSYDRLLGRLGDRALARDQVRPAVEKVLARWETPN